MNDSIQDKVIGFFKVGNTNIMLQSFVGSFAGSLIHTCAQQMARKTAKHVTNARNNKYTT